MSQPSKRCPACGSVNFIHARVCACGHQFTTRFPGDPGDPSATNPTNPTMQFVPPSVPYMSAPRNARKPWVAAVLGVILPGLGQLYNAQVAKGLLSFLASAALTCLFFPVGFIFWLALAFDAYKNAELDAKGYPTPSWNWLWPWS